MSIAGRHGKLNPSAPGASKEERWHRQEDLLTADVLGACRYLPPTVLLLPSLRKAVDSNGQTLEIWLEGRHVSLGGLTFAHIWFWPKLVEREPDALIGLGERPGVPSVTILLEAKLHSKQHEIEGMSQLGYYALRFAEGGIDEAIQLAPLRPVVYLTRHATCPMEELHRAERELATLAPTNSAVFWMNWHAFLESAQRGLGAAENQPWHRLLEDLVADLEARRIASPRKPVEFPLPELNSLGPMELRWQRRPPASDSFPLPELPVLGCIARLPEGT